MPCIFILSAVSYLKTEIILFHVRGSLCFHITFTRARLNCCTSYGFISCFTFLFMLCLFENWEYPCYYCVLFWHIIQQILISVAEKKIGFVLAAICLSQILAEVMKLCAIKVWLELIYFWTILLCQCVCREERSGPKGPVRSANVKIKHNDNKYGDKLNLYY